MPQSAANYNGAVSGGGASSSIALAENLLDNAGWTISSSSPFRSKTIKGVTVPLVVNLTVPQIDFLTSTANYLRNAWQAIGVQVVITPGSSNDIVNNLIPARNYESLIFGNVLGPSSDLYSFWDSSQDFAPGLNLSLYNNPTVNLLIERARQNTNSASSSQELATAQNGHRSCLPRHFPLLSRLRVRDQQKRAGHFYLHAAHRSLRPVSSDRELVFEYCKGAEIAKGNVCAGFETIPEGEPSFKNRTHVAFRYFRKII